MLNKSGSSKETDNYRPMILERLVHAQLVRYFRENKLLHDSQFDFRVGRCIEQRYQLIISENKLTIYVDFSKEFYTIRRSTIINLVPRAACLFDALCEGKTPWEQGCTITTKVKSFRIIDRTNEWFINYLFNRKLIVSYNRFKSSPLSLCCAVPQGSIIGPLLFLLLFIYFTKIFRYSKIRKDADYTVLSVSDNNIHVKLFYDF